MKSWVFLMHCEQFRELISAYIEKSITSPLAVKMEQHAAACEQCREVLSEVQSIWKAMENAPRVEPPTGLHPRIMEEVYTAVSSVPAPRWWELAWRPRFAFAAAAVLVMIALVMWSLPNIPGVIGSNAVKLSVVSGGGDPIAPVKSVVLPLWFEPFRSETGELRWALYLSASDPTAVQIAVGKQEVWSGVVQQETPVVLPSTPAVPVTAVQVVWGNGSIMRVWLPAELSVEARKPVIVLRDADIEQTLSRISLSYGTPLALVGEIDPLTRVRLESTGVPLAELVEKLARHLNLQVLYAKDGTPVLTAR